MSTYLFIFCMTTQSSIKNVQFTQVCIYFNYEYIVERLEK